MYHPMLTFTVMQTRTEDLARDLHRHQLRAQARQGAATRRLRLPRMRHPFATYAARRPVGA